MTSPQHCNSSTNARIQLVPNLTRPCRIKSCYSHFNIPSANKFFSLPGNLVLELFHTKKNQTYLVSTITIVLINFDEIIGQTVTLF